MLSWCYASTPKPNIPKIRECIPSTAGMESAYETRRGPSLAIRAARDRTPNRRYSDLVY